MESTLRTTALVLLTSLLIPPSPDIHQSLQTRDEGRIAFVSRRDGGMDLYVTDADGATLRRLTRDGSSYAPAWSPDGERLAFNSHRSGGWKIWVLDLETAQPRRLTRTSATGFNYEYYPAWSPDATHIAFEKWDNQGDNFEIHVVRADGSGETNLTRNPAHDRQPSWSPDGQFLLFASNRDGNEEIYVMHADGTVPRNLTMNTATDYGASWSPDGRRILFHSNRTGVYRTYIMEADGSNVTLVPSITASDHLQGWAPDGSNTGSIPFAAVRGTQSVWVREGGAIVFTSLAGGNRDVLLIDLESGKRRKLTNHRADDFMPAWWSPPQ